ncbi:MAG: hypothetical protein ACYDCC_05815 [Actinomycetota bacterium]
MERRKALILTLISLVGWATWQLSRDAGSPFGDLSKGIFTDHFSHMNTARLFTRVGWDIWRKPLKDSVQPLSASDEAQLPADIRSVIPDLDAHAQRDSGDPTMHSVYAVPGWPVDKPFISSWSWRPRLHPIGDMVLTAPVALLYSYSNLSFTDANRLLIFLFLIYVHISIYFLIRSGLRFDLLRPLGFLVFFIVYFEVIHWTLEGFYEGVVIGPLILCGLYLHQKRALPAIFAFTVAANLHFRSFFLAPLIVYAIVIFVREKQWRGWKVKEYALAGGSAILGFTSLGVFALLWHSLSNSEIQNTVSLSAAPVHVSAVRTLVIVSLVLIGLLLYSKAWLDAGIAAWCCVMMLLLREVEPWDVLSLLAWLGVPVLFTSENRLGLVRDVRIAMIAFFGIFVFSNTTLFAPTWLQRIFS